MNAAAVFDDLIEFSNEEAKRLGLSNLLETKAITRARRALGGSHTVVTYPPLNALEQCDPFDVLSSIRPERGIHLYAHIAYCEFLCPFCHYETTIRKLGSEADEKTVAYMDALALEWQRWSLLLSDSTLSSLYVGGGTPTALPLTMLRGFLERLLDFPRESNFSFCVESSPATAAGNSGRATLRELADLGATRISIGVQTTNEQLLRRSRGHDIDVLRDAMLNIASLGIDFNVDLIQDLPNQDDNSIIDDLNFIANYQPDQVSWYIMRLDQNSAWRRRYDNDGLDVATAYVSARRRIMIIEGMRRLGYIVQSGNRFQRYRRNTDQYKAVRGALTESLLGIGASAYSHGWGWFFRNTYSRPGHNGIREYIDHMNADDIAILDGVKTTLEDHVASRFINGIRAKLEIGNDLAAAPEYAEHVDTVLALLTRTNLATRNGTTVILTALGRIFEEEICTMFFPEHVRKRLVERGRL